MSRIIKLTESQLRDVVQKVINEQQAPSNASLQAKSIFAKLGYAASIAGGLGGTDEKKLIEAISYIKSVELYTEVVNIMRKTSIGYYKSIVQLLNGELDSDNVKEFKQIQAMLKKIGVTITGQVKKNPRDGGQTEILEKGSIRQVVGPAAKPSATPDASKPTYKVCQGFPIKYGCKQTEVGRLQQCLGLKVDYSFGPNTLVGLVDHSTKKYSKESMALQKQYVEVGVSKAAYDLLLQKCKKGVVKQKTKSNTSKLASAPVVDTRTKTDTTPLKPRELQTLPTTNLALSPEQIRARLQRDMAALQAANAPKVSPERKQEILANVETRDFDGKRIYKGGRLNPDEQNWLNSQMGSEAEKIKLKDNATAQKDVYGREEQ